MEITNIILLYVAIWIVVILHEIGHMPRHIKINKSIIPSASAMGSPGNIFGRLGGLTVNVLLFYLIFYYKPDMLILKYIGLVAFVHFIIYAIIGSIIPEPKESSVNVKTYVFDDVPNEYAIIFFVLVGFFIYNFGSYYLEIARSIL